MNNKHLLILLVALFILINFTIPLNHENSMLKKKANLLALKIQGENNIKAQSKQLKTELHGYQVNLKEYEKGFCESSKGSSLCFSNLENILQKAFKAHEDMALEKCRWKQAYDDEVLQLKRFPMRCQVKEYRADMGKVLSTLATLPQRVTIDTLSVATRGKYLLIAFDITGYQYVNEK